MYSKVPRRESAGRLRLIAWMQESPKVRRRALIARAVGVSPTAVSCWLHGDAGPTDAYRPALELLTGIEADAWRTDEERETAKRAMRLAKAALPILDETSKAA